MAESGLGVGWQDIGHFLIHITHCLFGSVGCLGMGLCEVMFFGLSWFLSRLFTFRLCQHVGRPKKQRRLMDLTRVFGE
jgi:hypothetical protein